MPNLDTTEAFVALMNRAQQGLFAYIRPLVPNAEDARDVLSETNLALWRKREEFSSERDFWPWACRFAQLQVLAYRERRGRDRLVFSEELVELLSHDADESARDASAAYDALEKCMDGLAEKQRHLLELRYSLALSVTSIAEKLNRSTGAVSDALYRIRIALGKCIGSKLAAKENP